MCNRNGFIYTIVNKEGLYFAGFYTSNGRPRWRDAEEDGINIFTFITSASATAKLGELQKAYPEQEPIIRVFKALGFTTINWS